MTTRFTLPQTLPLCPHAFSVTEDLRLCFLMSDALSQAYARHGTAQAKKKPRSIRGFMEAKLDCNNHCCMRGTLYCGHLACLKSDRAPFANRKAKSNHVNNPNIADHVYCANTYGDKCHVCIRQQLAPNQQVGGRVQKKARNAHNQDDESDEVSCGRQQHRSILTGN